MGFFSKGLVISPTNQPPPPPPPERNHAHFVMINLCGFVCSCDLDFYACSFLTLRHITSSSWLKDNSTVDTLMPP